MTQTESDDSNHGVIGYSCLALGGIATLVALNMASEASSEEKKLEDERLLESDRTTEPLAASEVKKREDDILRTEQYSIIAGSIAAVAFAAGAYFLFSESNTPKQKGAYLVPSSNGGFAGAYLRF